MNRQNRIQNPFRINVFVPVTSRWARVPIPTSGQQVMVRGELFRREENGLFTITLVDIALPPRDAGSSSGVPSPSPKNVRKVMKRNTVEAFEHNPDDNEPNTDAGPGPSGTISEPIEGGEAVAGNVSNGK